MRTLIIGGVAGGASTAARLRRNDEKMDIVLIERGPEISYANCGMPYYIGKVIKDRDKLVVVEKEYFQKVLKVDVRTGHEALSIDRDAKTVTVKDLENGGTFAEKYDYLVLAPGGVPLRPNLPGIDDRRVFTLRTLQDMDAIRDFIDKQKPGSAVVVGAGFIGLEMAENLVCRGLQVSIVELADQVMGNIDYEMAAAVHQHLHAKNVELYLKDKVTAFIPENNSVKVALQSGRSINAGLVMLSIGIQPEARLAVNAGLATGALGGIRTDEQMRTSDRAVFALGDAVEVRESVNNAWALIPLAGAANKQGRIVADNICGMHQAYHGTPGTAVAKVFDLTVGMTGASEKILKRRGLKYQACHLVPASHAGYYPGAAPLQVKLLFDPQGGRVLGAQVIGADGVDKRIDVFAAMIQLQRTVHDLAALELAYAPPYGSAKDPVNLAGMIAVNFLEGRNPLVQWCDVPQLQKEGALFLDVRSAMEYQLGHIDAARNIPLKDLRDCLQDVPKDKKVVVYCNQGKTAYFALQILRNNGFARVFNLSGGYAIYRQAVARQENVGIFAGAQIDKRDEYVSEDPGHVRRIRLDACGLQCPGPIMRLAKAAAAASRGDLIEMTVTDPGFANDAGIWCRQTGNTLLSLKEAGGIYTAKIQKGGPVAEAPFTGIPHDKTIVVFSGSFDKALAAFVIANGAVAMGRKVTMFFTFWGLNILRNSSGAKVNKGWMAAMLGMIMPRGARQLPMSQMNMFGMGPKMIRHIMRRKNIDSLESMIDAAIHAGVRIVACQMSMDMMGIKKEELIGGVEIGGVASYLGAAENADTNLFVG